MLKSYQKKFLDRIHQKPYQLGCLELLVVYGSCIRGEITSNSDVDFFLPCFITRKISKKVKNTYTYSILKCEVELELPASLYVVGEDDDIDKLFFLCYSHRRICNYSRYF